MIYTEIDQDLKSQFQNIPHRMAFKIGEVAEMLEIRPSILRYWEREFEELSPPKSHSNQRAYRRQDVKAAFVIKKLLYKDRFSIEGAKAVLKKEKFKKKVLIEKGFENQENLKRQKNQEPIQNHADFLEPNLEKKILNSKNHLDFLTSSNAKDSLNSNEREKNSQPEENKKINAKQIESSDKNSKAFVPSLDSSSNRVEVFKEENFDQKKEKRESLQPKEKTENQNNRNKEAASYDSLKREKEDIQSLEAKLQSIRESVFKLKTLLEKEDFFN